MTASSSSCSARPAPARRRRFASSAASNAPTQGSVTIGGHDVTTAAPAARDVAFVFQQYSLYPHLSAYDNLAFPLRSPARRVPEAEIRKRVEEIAEMLRISAKLQNRATQLSGGEMQRVAIGRALVRRPSIYLMDEPLSSLDAKLRSDLRLELKRIQHELGATILYVTHDQTEAMTMAVRIGVIESGRLIQIGTPREIYTDAGERLCRNPPRPAGDQPDPGRADPRRRRAGRRQDRRRPHRESQDRQGHQRFGARHRRLDRASRRPEPPSCHGRRPQAGDPRRSGIRPRQGRSGFAGAGRSPIFRRFRQAHCRERNRKDFLRQWPTQSWIPLP